MTIRAGQRVRVSQNEYLAFVVRAVFHDHDNPEITWVIAFDENDPKRRERRFTIGDVEEIIDEAPE